ncbi:MAG: hypothetical protein QI223_10025, partial [Candidatus Korarchaeota archaeon]|nr:hypothetical protein [Candidatus Korarchaeota archaeon]
ARRVLDRAGLRYALAVYAEPEFTVDVDFLAALDEPGSASLIAEAEKEGFRPEPSEPGTGTTGSAREVGHFLRRVRPPEFELTEEVFSRSRIVRLGSGWGTCPVVSPEDLAILFVVAGREERGDVRKAVKVCASRLAVGDFDEGYYVRRLRRHRPRYLAVGLEVLRAAKRSVEGRR